MFESKRSDKQRMILIGAFVLAILLVGDVFVATLRASYLRAEIALEESYFHTKLRLVRRFYPQLQELTYSEIVEQYDVDALYENIGRSRHHRHG